LVSLGAAKESDALTKLQCCLAPGQTQEPEVCNALREDARGVRVRFDLLDLFGKRDGAESARAPRTQGRGARIESHALAIFNLLREARLDLVERYRRGKHDAAR